MNNRESFKLKRLTLHRDKIPENLIPTKIDEIEYFEEYKEIYPDLKLTKEQAIARSMKFKVIPKLKKADKSLFNKYKDHFNIWKTVNKAISRDYGDDVCSYFKINVWITFHMMLVSLISIITIPMMIYYGKNSITDDWLPDYIDQLISTGQGWLTNTPVFYGFYNQTITNGSLVVFSVGRAYFYVNVFCRLFYILGLLRKFITNISMIYAIGLTVKSTLFMGSFLVMWDYKNINYRQIIYNKLIVKLFVKKVLNTHRDGKKMVILKNIIINTICYVIILVILERISWLITNDEKYIQSHPDADNPLWLILRVPITVSICNICATWLFDLIQCLEVFKNELHKLYSSLAKILVLNVGLLTLIMYHWTRLIWCVRLDSQSNNQTHCSLLRDNVIISQKSLLHLCWETWLGQRILMYFLTFVIVSMLFAFTVDIIKSVLKFLQFQIIKPKFFQVSLFGNIFFLDCLFWLGFYYSPVMPLIYLLVLLLTYFYNMGMISVSCFPRISSLHYGKIYKTLSLLMLLMSSAIAFACLSYHSIVIPPSRQCGPFNNLRHNFDPDGFIFSEYYIDQNLIWKLINFGSDIIFNNSGVWYSAIIIILVLFFKYVFKTAALSDIRNYVNNELSDMMLNKKSLAEDLRLEIRKIKTDKSTYKLTPLMNDNLDLFFDQFPI